MANATHELIRLADQLQLPWLLDDGQRTPTVKLTNYIKYGEETKKAITEGPKLTRGDCAWFLSQVDTGLALATGTYRHEQCDGGRWRDVDGGISAGGEHPECADSSARRSVNSCQKMLRHKAEPPSITKQHNEHLHWMACARLLSKEKAA